MLLLGEITHPTGTFLGSSFSTPIFLHPEGNYYSIRRGMQYTFVAHLTEESSG